MITRKFNIHKTTNKVDILIGIKVGFYKRYIEHRETYFEPFIVFQNNGEIWQESCAKYTSLSGWLWSLYRCFLIDVILRLSYRLLPVGIIFNFHAHKVFKSSWRYWTIFLKFSIVHCLFLLRRLCFSFQNSFSLKLCFTVSLLLIHCRKTFCKKFQ